MIWKKEAQPKSMRHNYFLIGQVHLNMREDIEESRESFGSRRRIVWKLSLMYNYENL